MNSVLLLCRLHLTMGDVGTEGDDAPAFDRVMTLKGKHGKCGSYTHNDGSLFIGDFDENGIKSGMGHLEVSKKIHLMAIIYAKVILEYPIYSVTRIQYQMKS